jgi:hypothetical protein
MFASETQRREMHTLTVYSLLLLFTFTGLAVTEMKFISLLSQYQFCVAGVGLGTAYAVKRKGTQGMLGFVAGGALGSIGDLIYGYNVACVAERDRYFGKTSNENLSPTTK